MGTKYHQLALTGPSGSESSFYGNHSRQSLLSLLEVHPFQEEFECLIDSGLDGDLISQAAVSKLVIIIEPQAPALVNHALNGHMQT